MNTQDKNVGGLKVRNGVIKRLIIQLLAGMPVATHAQLCTAVHN
jgi:hypothetical protein